VIVVLDGQLVEDLTSLGRDAAHEVTEQITQEGELVLGPAEQVLARLGVEPGPVRP